MLCRLRLDTNISPQIMQIQGAMQQQQQQQQSVEE
jgi:hypothetical protein